MPILSNILITVDDNNLVLTGTDLEIQLVIKIPIKNYEPGQTTVPARKFLDICRLLPNGVEIKFELRQEKVKIISGRSRFSLSTLAAENYPKFSESELEYKLLINAEKIKTSLEKTIFCMGNQDARYYLNGLLFHISNSKLKLVGSDGHRLAIYEYDIGKATGYEKRIILPRKGILELDRLLNENCDSDLSFQFSDSNVRIEIVNMVFSAKLVDSSYPDFSKIYNQPSIKISISRQLLKEALIRVSILADEKSNGVNFNISKGLLKLSSHNTEQEEEAEEELTIDYSGESIFISFNAQYFLDAISNLDSEIAVISISKNSSICFVENTEQKPYKFIVMPMRI